MEVDGQQIITYIEAITSNTNPGRAAIIGGGPIGVEFGYIWSNYGTQLTIIELLPRLLPNEEPEVSEVLEKAYKKLGVNIQTGTTVERVEKSAGSVKLTLKNGQSVEVDQVMVAVSFVPNTENIGLESVGVQVERGPSSSTNICAPASPTFTPLAMLRTRSCWRTLPQPWALWRPRPLPATRPSR